MNECNACSKCPIEIRLIHLLSGIEKNDQYKRDIKEADKLTGYERKVYIRLDDVLEILNNPKEIPCEIKNRRITEEEVRRVLTEIYEDISERIKNLEIKEIDE